jgi:hypothetical protein
MGRSPFLGGAMEIQLPIIGQATSNGSGNAQSSAWLSDPDSTTGNWDGLFDGQAGSSTSTSESSILAAARSCPTAC